MPKYYCDYCDSHLTHDSMSVRKTHNKGKKHKDNVIAYYQNYLDNSVQQRIDMMVQMASINMPVHPYPAMFPHVPGVQAPMPPMVPPVGMPNMTGAPPANGQMPFHGYGMPGGPGIPGGSGMPGLSGMPGGPMMPPHMMNPPNMMPPPMNGLPPGFQQQFYRPPPQFPPQFPGPPPSQ